ncbi:hypothetical protein SARC_04337 [Sphaeroforma arctica JP610]|uniref:folate gamma-glutamyl hydrolase n=1 Tax=Sphaeroforma arctica JP610 TaxID=667725 RepID=A0A0L0G3K5_9EUKA|nr:hypothetical protein SARC_04337 [Sphaeroforma arctica JP610]KNC83421.1 hypothetical protein SARC_04337 [Sphaeroforma arctica JP610]|eukprot:XP_014157323.1 hypothetical protein SARC_04337 [Sphaeroforma arctica JP610]
MGCFDSAKKIHLRLVRNVLNRNLILHSQQVSGFYDYYARWLEQSGARIVPIRYNAPREELDELFSSINGLLYTGGDLSLKFDTPYYKTAHYLYNKAIAANDEGDFFPIWGTCMGFQLISIMAAVDYSVLDHGVYDSDGIMLPLVPTEYASSSRMLARASKELLHDIFEKPTTVNLHHDGITPETWASNEKLSSFFDVISTNEDSKNRPFISTFEAKDYPIYGAQWHGEKVAFDFMDKTESNGTFINHSYEAVAVSQYFSNFFVSECRKSQHRFQSATEESNHLLYHFTPRIEGNSAVLYTFE